MEEKRKFDEEHSGFEMNQGPSGWVAREDLELVILEER